MRPFLTRLLLYGMLLLALNLALGYYLKTYETHDLKGKHTLFSYLRWQEYNNLDSPIEVLILGSSHAYRSYNPEILREELGLAPGSVFNFGSSAQTPVTGYFIFNEVLNEHHPQVVVLDIYATVFNYDIQLDNARINFQEMEWGENKLRFFQKGFKLEEQITLLFFPTIVYRNYFKPKLKKFLGLDYLPVEKGKYMAKGFVGNSDTLSLEKLRNHNQFDHFDLKAAQITAKNVGFVRQLKELCQQKGISLVLMSAPMSEISISKILDYPQIHRYFKKLAEELSVPYYDFNWEREASIKDEFHYYDDDHLNLAGANLFSEAAAQILKQHLAQK